MTYGDDFQRLSKYSRDTLQGKGLNWTRRPPLYKKYPSELERVELDEPEREGGLPLYTTLTRRRSLRDYRNTSVPGKILSQVIWAAQGITQTTEYHQFRTAPSAGGLFPVETYCVINRVENFKPGMYHYQVPQHALVLLKEGSFGPALARAALGQPMFIEAAFVLIWSAVVDRCKWKYDQRAYRYIYLDAGHIAQNAALAAISCGLGSCQVGAFFDDEVNRVIEVEGANETAIYMTTVGETG